MSKYDPLYQWLRKCKGKRIESSFADVERVLGCTLPRSAFIFDRWWNNETGDTRHLQWKAWLDAGFYAKADLHRQVVTFMQQ
jgi:hypothetical protein